MSLDTGISQQNAILFSQLAYVPAGTPAFSAFADLQVGGIQLVDAAAMLQRAGWYEWTAGQDPTVYSGANGNEFRVFINRYSGDIVIAFKGSDLTQVLSTDLNVSDQGYSQ